MPSDHPKIFSPSESHYVLLFLVGISLYGCYQIVLPYMNAIVLAVILAIICHPLYEKLATKLKNRKNLAAGLACGLLLLIVVFPLFIITMAVIQQGLESFRSISKWLAGGGLETLMNHPIVMKITALAGDDGSIIENIFPELTLPSFDLKSMLVKTSSTVMSQIANQSASLVKDLTGIVINFMLMLFVLFFLLRDYEEILDKFLHLSPLSSSHEDKIISRVKAVAKSAILGTLVTAAAQGLAGGIAFFICGLPGLFWGTMMAFASLIPVVGTALVWVPAAAYLFLSGHWGLATFMVIWSVAVVGTIDNFVRPLFMQGSAQMSTLMIFISILGGIHVFGMLGILYGPIIFGLAMVLLYIYSLEFGSFLKKQDRS